MMTVVVRSSTRLDAMRQAEEKVRAEYEPRAVARSASLAPSTKVDRRSDVRAWNVEVEMDLMAAVKVAEERGLR